MLMSDILFNKFEGLSALSREELAERWRKAYGCPPPPGVRRELLLLAAAWALQARHEGGLRPEARRLLKRAVAKVSAQMLAGKKKAPSAAGMAADGELPASLIAVPDSEDGRASEPIRPPAAAPPAERRTLSPGARLIRDWQGRTHVVDVVEGGFLYGGKRHRSLSAIAKEITGAHWSGPRFFGV